MSNNEIVRFQAEVKANAELRGEVKRCGADIAKVVQLANAKGYDFKQAELEEHVRLRKAELDDNQLGKVAGGVGQINEDPLQDIVVE